MVEVWSQQHLPLSAVTCSISMQQKPRCCLMQILLIKVPDLFSRSPSLCLEALSTCPVVLFDWFDSFQPVLAAVKRSLGRYQVCLTLVLHMWCLV